MTKKKAKTGVQEWADTSVNIQYGCKNNCSYCYARKMAKRFNRIPLKGWDQPILKWRLDLPKNKKVMFPSTHDIDESNLWACCEIIGALLDRNNRLLIVSKPWLHCIESICYYFKYDIQNIAFRFTIGSVYNDILKTWEPNAPEFEERIYAVKEAIRCGHNVSISCEPLLDVDCAILKYFTEIFPERDQLSEIWVGSMQYSKDAPDLNYQEIYTQYKDNPKIKWKDSFRKHLKEID